MDRIVIPVALLAIGAGLLGCQTPSAPPPDHEFRLGFRGVRVRKPIESLRERRFRDMVPQRLDYSCGAAAVATLLRFFYDDPVEESEIVLEMLREGDAERIRQEGFSLRDLKQYVERRGYEGRGFRVGPGVLELLAIPAITMINTRGYSHFAVIKGARDGAVHLADPALGHRAMRKGEFLEEWNGVVFFVAARRDATSASPLERLEARVSAPGDEVRWLEHLGLRHLAFSPEEF